MDPGKELVRLRKEKGLSQKALADIIGTNPDYIWDLEHGKLPGLRVASKLAKVFNVSLYVFWIKRDNLKPYKDTGMVFEFEEFSYLNEETQGLEILNLSKRSYNALYGAKIITVGDLLLLSEKEFSTIRGLGPASQCEIKDKLEQYIQKLNPNRTSSYDGQGE